MGISGMSPVSRAATNGAGATDIFRVETGDDLPSPTGMPTPVRARVLEARAAEELRRAAALLPAPRNGQQANWDDVDVMPIGHAAPAVMGVAAAVHAVHPALNAEAHGGGVPALALPAALVLPPIEEAAPPADHDNVAAAEPEHGEAGVEQAPNPDGSNR